MHFSLSFQELDLHLLSCYSGNIYATKFFNVDVLIPTLKLRTYTFLNLQFYFSIFLLLIDLIKDLCLLLDNGLLIMTS